MENDLLTYLFPGWQKVCDRYNMTGYVFKSDAPLGYSAVINKTQVGRAYPSRSHARCSGLAK